MPEEKLWWYIHLEQLHSQIGFCCAVFYGTNWPRKMKLIGFFSLFFSVCEVWAHGFGGLKSVMKNSGSLPQEMDGQILRPGEHKFWCSSEESSAVSQVWPIPKSHWCTRIFVKETMSFWVRNRFVSVVFRASIKLSKSNWGGSKTGKEIPEPESLHDWQRVSLKPCYWVLKRKDIG